MRRQPTHLLKVLNDDFWVLDVFGNIGDHQCPRDLGGEGEWRSKTQCTGTPACQGLWVAQKLLEPAFYLPHLAGGGTQGNCSGVHGFGFWGEVKSTS